LHAHGIRRQLFRTIAARLRRIAMKYALVDDLQDLYQEILLQLWRGLGI
jgi:DNA-directed RNA polymerase specialized sigma24 family protein